MGIKPGPKRIAESTGKPDRRQRDNKETPRNISSLKPHKHKKGGLIGRWFEPTPLTKSGNKLWISNSS